MSNFMLNLPLGVLAARKDKIAVPMRTVTGWAIYVYDYADYQMMKLQPRFVALGKSYYEAELGARELLVEFPEKINQFIAGPEVKA
jgi:hypothetical protein